MWLSLSVSRPWEGHFLDSTQSGKGSGQETSDAGNGTMSTHKEFSWRWKADILVL